MRLSVTRPGARRRPRSRVRQRGVAVITALLLTTLAVSIVASLFWQQQVQVRSMENQRLHLQTKWILRGALDWATLVLRQDARDSDYTALNQVWATPLAETRLDQYIERERVAGEVFNATLSGNIVDATSRYNLNNLAQDGKVDPEQMQLFADLLQVLQLDRRLALRAASFVAAGQPPAPPPEGEEQGDGQEQGQGQPAAAPRGARGGAVPMPLLQVDDLLAVPGFTPAVLEKLRPFLIVLPSSDTTLNVNTAPPELLAALLPNGTMAEANRLVAQRKTAPWINEGQFQNAVGVAVTLPQGLYAVRSDYFLILSRIRLDRAALDAESLVQRSGELGGTRVVWTRQH